MEKGGLRGRPFLFTARRRLEIEELGAQRFLVFGLRCLQRKTTLRPGIASDCNDLDADFLKGLLQ
jgi:hypothetical protein